MQNTAVQRVRAPTALFVLSTGHVAYRELKPVLLHFREAGWHVIARLGSSGPESIEAVRELRGATIQAELMPEGVGYAAAAAELDSDSIECNATPTVSAMLRDSLKKVLRPVLLHRLVALWRYFQEGTRNLRWARSLLAAHAPDVVLLNAFHSAGQVDNAVLRAAHLADIRTFCLTNSPYVGELVQLVARLNHLHSGMAGNEIRAEYDALNWFLAKLFPSWTRKLADGSVVFYWDPLRIVAAVPLGLSMNRLWLKPSLDFDKVFVFGEFSRTLLVESGYPAEKIVVAGQPLLDGVLARLNDPRHRAEIAEHIGVPLGEPFLLLNIEPSFEHSYASEKDHWERFHIVMRACSGHGLPLVLSLHPLCKTSDYVFAEKQYGAQISTKIMIHELYPWCAVNVSFPCSTNLLALEFHKPLVVYDFHGIVDRDAQAARLNKLPGMLYSASEEGLRAHVAAAIDMARRAPRQPLPSSSACSVIFATAAASIGPRT